MALPMDEQRILEEMERMLAADDPRLAARLAAFGQPGVGHVLRTRRARAVLSLLTLGVIACVAAVVYMVNVLHVAGNQVPPHNARTSQAASARPGRSLKASHAVRVLGTPTCKILLTPTHCTAWKPAAGPAGRQPSPAADRQARSGSQAAKP